MDTRHPTLDQLTQLAEGLYSTLARTRLEQHLAGCAQCFAELDWLTTTLVHMQLEATEAVPDSVAAGARRLFRPGARAGADAQVDLESLLLATTRSEEFGADRAR